MQDPDWEADKGVKQSEIKMKYNLLCNISAQPLLSVKYGNKIQIFQRKLSLSF